jgi:uncharacterized membrane protein YgdD (TMEM256/DUF423 family)
MILKILLTFAGLMGAAGVALGAVAVHASPGVGLDSASQMLLVHGPAVIAICAAISAGLIRRPLALFAAIVMVTGALLFSGDVTLRALAGERIFPMAAPTGGSLMILSWLALALSAVFARRA